MQQPSDSLANLTLITGPTVEPVTLAEAKAHLRIDHSEEDSLIEALITAAREHIDGKAGWLGRALVEQTWELSLTRFPDDAIRLPLPPLVEVTSVTYVDTAGATQPRSAALYQVLRHDPALIVPAYGQAWPSTREMPEAVKVRFRAGYEPGSGSPTDYAENVPRPIKQAILLLVAHWYGNREAAAETRALQPLPFAVMALLAPYRSGGL